MTCVVSCAVTSLDTRQEIFLVMQSPASAPNTCTNLQAASAAQRPCFEQGLNSVESCCSALWFQTHQSGQLRGAPGTLAATPKKLMMRPISSCKLSPMRLLARWRPHRHRPVVHAAMTPAEERAAPGCPCHSAATALQCGGAAAWQLVEPPSAAWCWRTCSTTPVHVGLHGSVAASSTEATCRGRCDKQ
jgi:hypothetical protein